ncbi:D-alanyl-D-alanine carboxypeptidase family protein [Methylosarcina fibrata]|uniref:D-alanyl-D-alanine carboxypeptidase family protein n=1 Tax=Methylosarcina fibrata TaxID=105972 RepID=UPI00036D5240|nr:D-alanyl-D-alanine carboxypeptidase family protein [Methylosarcina fibrata]
MLKSKSILFILLPLWLLFMSGASYGRYAAIMIDADTGNVLHEVEATQPWYPASLTKVMTLYMTFEALNTGQIQLYDNMTASAHASRQPTSKLGLRAGETLTVEDAILALITRSANDAAVVLAEHLGGTEENFARKMTAKARLLGMHSSRFMNATGLPNEQQVTTSRDMAILAWKIQRHFPEYYPYFSSHSFFYKGRELRGINKFTARYPGAEGMKTGFTCGSGFNLIGAAHQNGKHLIGVVLGGMTSAERYQLMMNMMDNGFSNRYTADAGRNIDAIPAGYGGEPPYQLDCGKGARNSPVSSLAQNEDLKPRYLKTRSAGKSTKRYSKVQKAQLAGKRKYGSKKWVAARSKNASTRIKAAGSKKARSGAAKTKLAKSGKTRLASAGKSSKTVKAKKIAGKSGSKKLASTGTGKSKHYHRPG